MSDGTEGGTQLIASLWPGVNAPEITSIASAGGKVWFSARTAASGRELWSSDGTNAGTQLVEELALRISR